MVNQTRKLWSPIIPLLLVASWCAAQEPPRPPFTLDLINVRRVWDRAPFNGFTDLIRFQGNWYLALREATAHGVWDGSIRILRSDNAKDWQPISRILCPPGKQIDLRDPKLSVTPAGSLMLTSTAYWPRESCQTYCWFTPNGKKWGTPYRIGPQGEWLWRTVWHKGTAYNFGASRLEGNTLQLYKSHSGKRFVPHGPRYLKNRESNETAVVFDLDGTCYVLLRQSPNAMLGVGAAPYTDFAWKDLDAPVGGPEMILLPNGELLATVRLYDDGEYTALCWIDRGTSTLNKMLRLPSGGDTSYAGMVFSEKRRLWISYYSSHEGKTNVYLAELTVSYGAE